VPDLLDRLWRRWEDRAAVRLEHDLEPGLRRRLDRLPSRVRGRLELRAERRARHRDIGAEIGKGPARAWGAGRTFTRQGPPRW
jgi:hypothetical protein